MTLIYLAPEELSPPAESALVCRLIEDGENPNDWTVLAVWASGGVYAVVLRRGGDVRAFTVGPKREIEPGLYRRRRPVASTCWRRYRVVLP